MTIIVTGGAGFIGSALVRYLIAKTTHQVVTVDNLTYAGHRRSLGKADQHARHTFVKADICNAAAMAQVFTEHRPDAVMHLAAESHVDRSIDGAAVFIQTNIVGTQVLLEQARSYYGELQGAKKDQFRFLHVSTDEVYGSLGATGQFTEQTAYDPRSPYAASKASSDHLVRAWHHTYGLPVLVTNCSNNYGPYQHPEKLIPVVILNALAGKPIPVYGNGQNVRDWLYVDDHVRALVRVLQNGTAGETYTIGGHNEKQNLEVVRTICTMLDELRPTDNGQTYRELITFVTDRPGHDWRYAIDASKIQKELGWAPQEAFESGIKKTVRWYLANREWCKAVAEKNMD